MARKALTKKTRFEVFKRDSFTCQYCGGAAPDVVLNVDHIVPVASGGDNKLVNLITSCFPCNSGKGKRELDDNAVVNKQMSQLKALNERSEQIQMIAEWRAGLADLENRTLEYVRNAVDKHLDLAGKQVTDSYLRTDLKTCLSKYGLNDVLISIEKSANQYLKDPNNPEHRGKFLNMIPRIAYWQKREADDPEEAQLRKIAYTANRIWTRCNPQTLQHRLIQINRETPYGPPELMKLVSMSSGIMAFEDNLQRLMEGAIDV